MTNEIAEILTNTVSIATHISPEKVAYDFKQWMGVIGLIYTALYTAFHVAFPKVQSFIDSRDGGDCGGTARGDAAGGVQRAGADALRGIHAAAAH